MQHFPKYSLKIFSEVRHVSQTIHLWNHFFFFLRNGEMANPKFSSLYISITPIDFVGLLT